MLLASCRGGDTATAPQGESFASLRRARDSRRKAVAAAPRGGRHKGGQPIDSERAPAGWRRKVLARWQPTMRAKGAHDAAAVGTSDGARGPAKRASTAKCPTVLDGATALLAQRHVLRRSANSSSAPPWRPLTPSTLLSVSPGPGDDAVG